MRRAPGHARPAGILSKAAKGFESKVTMTKNGKVADMKKIFAVMGLAVKCGETVTIAADGPDEDAAIEELTNIANPTELVGARPLHLAAQDRSVA